MKIKIDAIIKKQYLLGEGLTWDADEQCLWWTDIITGLIYEYQPLSGKYNFYNFGEQVGCLARRESGGLILAAKSGFWFFDHNNLKKKHIFDPEIHLINNRFNDGVTDLQGRFWAGTMKDGGKSECKGSFYCLDQNKKVNKWKNGIWTTNGLAFSPDGEYMYFSDSNPRVQKIWVSKYNNDTGIPDKPKIFFDANCLNGRPDGATVDEDGCYWFAGIDGWEIYQISPNGKLLQTIKVPVEKPTKPIFGGTNLDILYFTSTSINLKNPEKQPQAGCVFSITGLRSKGITQIRYQG